MKVERPQKLTSGNNPGAAPEILAAIGHFRDDYATQFYARLLDRAKGLTWALRAAIFMHLGDIFGYGALALYFARLSAAATVAALLIGAIMYPNAPASVAERAASFAPETASFETRACPIGGSIFTSEFANITDVISVSPLGGVTAPGEPLPAPYIRVNMRKGATQFERRRTDVLSPARADITAVERRILRREDGSAVSQSWTVHFDVCENVSFYVSDLDKVNPDIIRRVGGLVAFEEISGPDHVAAATNLRVRSGDVIGEADGFDIGLEDRRTAPADLVRPERYQTNPYLAGRVYDVRPELISAISTDHTRAQCPIDYMPSDIAEKWTPLLGDAFGMRRAKGDNACRTALVDEVGAAQGAWFTDAANNGVASKVSAIALAPDNVDPSRQIFSLHGRLKSLNPNMVALPPKQRTAREEAAKDFLTFSNGQGLVNRHFADTIAGPVYCYEGLRANFVGPRINGVILLSLKEDENAGDRMRMEARGDVLSCADLPEPWAFTGAETTFFR